MPPKGARYVAPDGRLFGDDEPHTEEYTYGRDDGQMRLSATPESADVLGLLLGQWRAVVPQERTGKQMRNNE